MSRNTIKLVNANSVTREYGAIPPLWQLAHRLSADGDEKLSEQVLQVWHMAHDLRAVVEEQGQARIIDVVKRTS